MTPKNSVVNARFREMDNFRGRPAGHRNGRRTPRNWKGERIVATAVLVVWREKISRRHLGAAGSNAGQVLLLVPSLTRRKRTLTRSCQDAARRRARDRAGRPFYTRCPKVPCR